MARIDLVDISITLGSRASPLETTASRLVAGFFGCSPEDTPPPAAGAFSLKDINLTVPDGKTMVILGPSGCGKSTLLRVIAGLLRPDSGQVLYNREDLTNQAPRERGIGMVFQSYALYPHFSAKKN
ncbi:MAG: ATP-binding cassette domain-containing protein, partial [Anaerolineales bacterium]|nr:ATP-binding cassette domain-containing protein [Anaerolineales bacterium]